MFDPESMALADAPNTIAKAHLFFDITDTNESGYICKREIQALCEFKKSERIDVAKERRKMMLEKVIQTIFEHLKKPPTATLTRDEIVHAVGTIDSVHSFFAKGLYIAANLG